MEREYLGYDALWLNAHISKWEIVNPSVLSITWAQVTKVLDNVNSQICNHEIEESPRQDLCISKVFAPNLAVEFGARICHSPAFDVCKFGGNSQIVDMRFSAFRPLVLAVCALSNLAVATSSCAPGLVPRPTVLPSPYNVAKPHYQSPPRTKVCYLRALGDGQDDSQGIFSALKACNNGGTVVLLDSQYIIAKPLDLTFLEAVDFVIQGEVSFTSDINFWLVNTFQYTYQSAALFWQIGGQDVNIYGGGTINGNGQVWWDRIPTNSTILRPILLGIMGMQSGTISNLKMINPPNWFHLVANSSDLIFDKMSLIAMPNDTNAAKNSGRFSRPKSNLYN